MCSRALIRVCTVLQRSFEFWKFSAGCSRTTRYFGSVLLLASVGCSAMMVASTCIARLKVGRRCASRRRRTDGPVTQSGETANARLRKRRNTLSNSGRKKAKRAAEQQAKKAKLEEGSSGSDSDSDSSSSSSSSSVKAPEPRAAPYRPLTESDLRAAVQMMRDGKSVPEVQAVVNRWQ